MKRANILAAALMAVAVVAVPAAQAQTVTVKVLGAGSSAMWQTAATGAFVQLAGAGGGHFTVKGTCTGTNNCAQIADSRSTSIVPQTGNLWVVWSSLTASSVKVWAYISVDSVVGNRTYFATTSTGTRATSLQLDPELDTTGPPAADSNLITSNLWGCDNGTTLSGGVCTGTPILPTVVFNALQNHIFTAGFTDIRPEDAYYASCRVLNPLDATGAADALGYGTIANCGSATGININSAFTTNYAQPVDFKIKGTDPITHGTIKGFKVVDVGAEPIVILVNRTNTTNGLGLGGATPVITDVELPVLQTLFSGAAPNSPNPGAGCFASQLNASATSNVNPILREPMSGTMNTFEHTNIRCSGDPLNETCLAGTVPDLSQESGIGQPTSTASPTNPLNLQCAGGGGSRMRVIGTGEMVGNGIKTVTDAIGYAFFSYGNVSKIAGSASYGYLTLNGVDGIVSGSNVYTNGQLPVCTSGAGTGVCPAAPGSSFTHLRDGTYRSWSVVRGVSDFSGANLTNLKALVAAIQNNVNLTTPDFVPFVSTGGDPGLQLVRSHFPQAGRTPNNGGTCGAEAGGDMGGYILTVNTCTTGEHQ